MKTIEEFLEELNKLPSESKEAVVLPLPEKPEEFLSQLIEAYPREDFPTLRKVIAIGKVKYIDKDLMPGMPMTAAVMNTKPVTLMFGKKFMEETTRTLEDRQYIFSHELTHLVLDHFAKDIIEQFEKARKVMVKVKDEVTGEETGEEKEEFEGLGFKAMHIIVDCQVNATVINSLKDPKYHEFVKSYYHKEAVPYCFFRPDGIPTYNIEGQEPDLEDEKTSLIIASEHFHDQQTDPRLMKLMKFKPTLVPLKPEMEATLRQLHTDLYSEDGVTNKELIDKLMPWFEEKQDSLDQMISKLLGNHKDILSDRGGSGSNSDEMSDIADALASDLSEYLNKKQDKEQPGPSNKEGEGTEDGESPSGRKAGKGGDLRDRQLKNFIEDNAAIKAIRNNLKVKLVISPVSRIFKAIEDYVPRVSVRSVVPNFHDRRTATMYAKGRMPVFHTRPQIGSKVLVPCYLDVSGSQEHVLDHTSLAVSKLRQELGNVVYCFSTKIYEAKVTSLKNRDSIQSTGGTDFDIVAEHILKNNFRCAVIITDGEASLDSRLAEKLKQRNVQITVGWTTPSPSKYPLEQVAKKTFFVFDPNQYQEAVTKSRQGR